MIRPALIFCLLALAIEIPFAIFLSLWGIKPFVYYLSESDTVAGITQKMWKVLFTIPSPFHLSPFLYPLNPCALQIHTLIRIFFLIPIYFIMHLMSKLPS